MRGVNPAVTWRPAERTTAATSTPRCWTSSSTPDAGLPLVRASSGRTSLADGRTLVPDAVRLLASRRSAATSSTARPQLLGPAVAAQQDLLPRPRLGLRRHAAQRRLPQPASAASWSSATLDLLDDTQGFLGNQLEVVADRRDRRRRPPHPRRGGGRPQHRRVHARRGLRRLRRPRQPGRDHHRAAVPDPRPVAGGRHETTVVAPYVLDQIAFSDRFQVLAGVRYDTIDFEDEVTGTSRVGRRGCRRSSGWSTRRGLASRSTPTPRAPSPRPRRG